jgi:hypothetical protein
MTGEILNTIQGGQEHEEVCCCNCYGDGSPDDYGVRQCGNDVIRPILPIYKDW